MGESYEIFKTEKRFRSRNKLYFIWKYYCFFQNKIVLKQKTFTHASVLYTHDGKTMVYFIIYD